MQLFVSPGGIVWNFDFYLATVDVGKIPGGQRDILERVAIECLGLAWCGAMLERPTEM